MKTAMLMHAVVAAFAALMFVSSLQAQAAPAPASMPAPTPAASQPASGPAQAAIPDHSKSILDEYDAAKERQKFLAAAGVDNEMDRTQFDADKAKGGGFVRPFDRWEGLLRFDKNGNKKIDWFEADAYRQDLRQKLLAVFGADSDAKMTPDQRGRANLALEGGWAGLSDRGRTRLAAAVGDLAGAGGGGADEARQLAARIDREEFLRKYRDTSDANITDAQREAAIKEFQDRQREETFRKYERDANGELTEEGRAAMREDMRKQGQPWKAMIDKLNRRLFDTDEEGQLTETGKAQAKDFQKQLQAIGKEWDTRMNDLDGDGNVSPEERKEVQAQWRLQALRLIGMSLRYMDADGDGKVTVEEREAFVQRAQKGIEKWLNKFVDKYDTSGTGKFGDEQRAELLKGLREEIERRVKKFDTEGKGRLTPAKTIDMLEDFAKEIGLAPKPKGPPPPEDE